MNIKKLPTTIFLIFSLSISYGQTTKLESFSEDLAEFTTQLRVMMTERKSKPYMEAHELFENMNKLGRYDETALKGIRDVCNDMLLKKMSISPYFTNYLKCAAAARADINKDNNLNQWNQVLRDMMASMTGRKFTPFNNFLKFSLPFFENKLIRESRAGTNWQVSTDKFDWTFDESLPFLDFPKTDLTCYRKKDTIVLMETSGKFNIKEGFWKGSGGKVTWERHGLKKNVYAEIDDYEFEVKSGVYEAPSARLSYPTYFGTTILEGSFADKLIVGNKSGGGSYPRFKSKDQIVKLTKLGRGIDYVGGFRLEGTTVYGFGSKEEPALLTIENNSNQRVFKGLAEVFVIKSGEQITGEQVQTSVYFDKDSITHPSSNLKFLIENRDIKLTRAKRASDRAPFFSSLHQVNVNSDDLLYKFDKDSLFIGKPTIQMGAGKDNEVIFESLKYFQERDFARMQNVTSYNPVSIIKVEAERAGEGSVLEANYLAKAFDPKFSVDNIKGLLYQLVEEGFIDYDSEEELVTVKDKVKHFAEANAENVDYDYVKLFSKSKETNAGLSTATQEMLIRGVESVEFSAAQKVGLLPLGDQLVMKRDRDMDFNGKMFAGYAQLIGNDYHFLYQPYRVDMDSIRYFDLYIPSGLVDERTKEEKAFALNSRIENFSAVLLIDAPENKSGKEEIEIFPSLQSKGPSYVYYDKDNKQGSAYKRDSFYFELDKFSFNSLDKFVGDDVTFGGQLVSFDIFPNFKESIKIMPDSSLGFVTRTPPEGYPAYQEKGNFNGEVSISNDGLLGKGIVGYLGAEIETEDAVFRPKWMRCTAEKFDLEEVRNADPEFPQAKGTDVSIDWRPYRDSMYIRTKEENFSIYRPEEHELTGLLILSPSGLKGVGDLDWAAATMGSDLFNFGAYSVTADTTNVKIKAFDADEFALTTSNLNSDVDFDKQIGIFKANDEFIKTQLPYNQYETNMNEFTWDMKNKTIDFKALEGKLAGFTSTHPDQDSLYFEGKNALYSLETNELSIGGVPFIKSCDALIYTETGAIDIKPGGVMTTLENAKIVADTVTQTHTINRATVDVLGRKDYKATGYYEYNIGDKQQEIFFQDIVGARVGKGSRSEKATETRANGTVEESQNFYIDTKTKFLGDIGLQSSTVNLNFNGFAKLDTETLPGSQWFSVQSEAAKEDLKIKFDVPKTTEGENLHTGIFLSKETALMYPRVLQPKLFRKDREIMPMKGLIDYDEKKDIFIFGDSAKVNKAALSGNQLIFNNKTGDVEMEGKFKIGEFLKYQKVTAAGTAKSSYSKLNAAAASDSTGAGGYAFEITAEMIAGIDLVLPEKLLKMMAKDFKSSSFEAEPLIYATKSEFYKRAVAEFVPETGKNFKDVAAGLNVGAFDLPKKMNKFSLFFSHLPMKWDPDYQSFVSSNPKIGLYSINGEPINKAITGFVEFKMPTTDDDRLYIYLKSPSGYYYFVGFKDGILNIVSDNLDFNDAVINLKKKEAVVKMGDDEYYEIVSVEPSSASMFARRVQATHK